MTRKFDIFEVLKKVDTRDVNFFQTLEPQDKKAIPLFVVNRWMSGCTSEYQLAYLNECVNPYMFSLGAKHPDLMWMLMCGVSSGKMRRYKWLKLPAASASSTARPVTEKVLHDIYGYSSSECKDALNILDFDAVCDLADQMGCQQDTLDAIAKEWGVKVKRTRSPRKSKTESSTDQPTLDVMSAFAM